MSPFMKIIIQNYIKNGTRKIQAKKDDLNKKKLNMVLE